MARPVELKDGDKPLADCTLADIEERAEGASPATVIGNNVELPARYAWIAKRMREAGAKTVADLGEQEAVRLEQGLELHLASAADIFKGLQPPDAKSEN